jgi:hypothetical protein
MGSSLLSRKQVRDILDLIRDTHFAFMVELGGDVAIPPEELSRLRSKGRLPAPRMSLIQRAYEYGLLAAKHGPDHDATISLGAFMAFLNSSAAGLSARDQRTVRDVTDHMVSHVNGMSLDLQRKFHRALAEADKHIRRLRDHAISKITSEGAARREGVREIAARLRKATRDLRKDWTIVAATELNNWIQEGKAAAIRQRSADKDPLVFKRPRPDACPYCRILYLEEDGVTPRVFRLSDLVANGTNHDRKANRPTLSGSAATEWKPTLDSVHPFCRCSLQEMPKGYGFDDKGKLVWKGLEKALKVSALDRLLADHECEH